MVCQAATMHIKQLGLFAISFVEVMFSLESTGN